MGGAWAGCDVVVVTGTSAGGSNGRRGGSARVIHGRASFSRSSSDVVSSRAWVRVRMKGEGEDAMCGRGGRGRG